MCSHEIPCARVIDINLAGTFNVLRLGADRIAETELIGSDGEERGRY